MMTLRWIGFVCVAAVAAGCTVESESEDLDDGEDHESEDVGEAPDSVVSCASGYHSHYVDWGHTQTIFNGNCGYPTGYPLDYGHQFCMESTSAGFSCGGYWWVYGYNPSRGYAYIKINALNGH